MQTKGALAMALGIDPKVDYAFKRVFGDERNVDILVHLLNAILSLPEPIVSVELLNPFSPQDFQEDKLTVLDVKARDNAGRLINIEVQLLLRYHFVSRVLYYWAGLYRQQLRQGDDYSELRPTISICLVNEILFPQVDDYALRFTLRDLQYGVCLCDDLQIHLLQLPKFQRKLEEITTPLEHWLYIFQHGESMDPNQLPRQLSGASYHRAMKELEMLTQDETERERYESRLKAIRDERGMLLRGLEEGRAKGLAEGRAEGIRQGELIGQIRQTEKLLSRPISPHEQLASLSLDELRQRLKALEAEFPNAHE